MFFSQLRWMRMHRILLVNSVNLVRLLLKVLLLPPVIDFTINF